MISSILESISRIDHIKPEDIPNIDLYMDQVTTFMEEQLAATKRFQDDKILTKTMINNYAKNKLLPPPEKKRYSKEHVLMLIFIYYFKNILSISDIQALFTPIVQKYFKSMTEKDMTYIYNEVFSMEKEQIDAIFRRSDSKSGIGIKNVNDRLKIWFGEAYGITIESVPDEGTRVIVRMPKKQKE